MPTPVTPSLPLEAPQAPSATERPRALRSTAVLGLGAGGHAEVVLEILRLRPEIEVVAFLTPEMARHGNSFAGVRIAGGDEKIGEYVRDGVRMAFNGVGGFGRNSAHRRLFEQGKEAGLTFLSIMHPTAVVSPSATIGEGSVVLAHAVVNTGARVGCNVIVNTAATVDHHCVIEDHVHIAPGVHLAGGVTIEVGAQIGLGTVVREGVRIGRGAVVGAGSVVLHDVPPDVTAVGSPVRFL